MPRQAARLMLSTLLLSASTGLAYAQASDDIVKIGVLTDISGPASTPTGQGSVTAAQMAIDDFGGTVLGKPIQLISADHQLNPHRRRHCPALVRRRASRFDPRCARLVRRSGRPEHRQRET